MVLVSTVGDVGIDIFNFIYMVLDSHALFEINKHRFLFLFSFKSHFYEILLPTYYHSTYYHRIKRKKYQLCVDYI